jgi:predicted aspartyl protease
MGLTYLTLGVGNPADPQTTKELQFLIDSGAIYSIVPAPVLDDLGIKPVSEESFQLANGASVKRKKGIALFTYEGRIGGADVIFGEPDDAVLLGAFTLESLGLALDPLRRELKPLPMLLVGIRR